MIVYDVEVFKHDWMICWLDCETRKTHFIVNDKAKLEKMYEHYKHRFWVGYNSRNYDQWIIKAILCDFNPYDVSMFIIQEDRKGFEYSNLLRNFPILNYDCSVGFRSLKELEAFMGHSIVETSVPFDIDRPLTRQELLDSIKYCTYDVMETFEVFVETANEFESHIGLIKEYDMPLSYVSKTKAQLSAIILGATMKKRNDEFELEYPETLELGENQYILDWYEDWKDNIKDYSVTLDTEVNGVPHVFAFGGIHGALPNYIGEGTYIMADVSSYYPAIMIEYDFLSRNVVNPSKYKNIRDERLIMKQNKDPRQYPRKIVLNSTFGASKDKYNNLYDPRNANNICVAGQLLLADLLDKLKGKCELIQSNTDGILVKLYSDNDKDNIISICDEWGKRVRMEMEYDIYTKVIQRDVNNYLIVDEKGKYKSKGAVVKKLNKLDNDLPIVNKAVVEYFLNNTSPYDTIMGATDLIDFQKVTKITGKYDYGSHNGIILQEKVHRCFASKDANDGSLYKKHKNKDTLDKTPSTPEKCFIINDNILDMPIPSKLDRKWYIELAEKRINEFIGKK